MHSQHNLCNVEGQHKLEYKSGGVNIPSGLSIVIYTYTWCTCMLVYTKLSGRYS